MVSFPLRVSALCTTAREIIDSGVIGTVENVQAINNVPFYSGGYYHGWMRDDEETGGLWLQKATQTWNQPSGVAEFSTPWKARTTPMGVVALYVGGT